MATDDGQQAARSGRRASSGLPFPIRALRTGEIEGRRRLFDRWPVAGRAIDLGLLADVIGGEPRLALGGVERVERMEASGPALVLALAHGDGPRAVLGLPAALARRLADLALGRQTTPDGVGLSTGEEGALLYALDRAAGDWIEAGGVRFGMRGFLAGLEQGEALLSEGEIWRVTANLTIPGGEGQVWLLCTAPETEARRPGRDPGPLPTEAAANWPAEIGIEVGDAGVPLASIRGLAPGDLVVLDRLAHPEGTAGGAPARLVSGAFGRAIRWLDATRFEVVTDGRGRTAMAKPDGETAMCAKTVGGAEAGGAPDVDVRVEVARIRMGVGEAMGLLPGRIVELDRPVGAEVVLRVGDGRVAAGVLVEHEGELAVEITEVP